MTSREELNQLFLTVDSIKQYYYWIKTFGNDDKNAMLCLY